MNCRERLNAEIHDECLILLGKMVQRMNTYIEYSPTDYWLNVARGWAECPFN